VTKGGIGRFSFGFANPARVEVYRSYDSILGKNWGNGVEQRLIAIIKCQNDPFPTAVCAWITAVYNLIKRYNIGVLGKPSNLLMEFFSTNGKRSAIN